MRSITVDGLFEFSPGAEGEVGTFRRLLALEAEYPQIVCLCGSTRFVEVFNQERERLTRDGKIVLSIEIVTTQSREQDPQYCDPELKKRLDQLHFRKILLADRVRVLNVGGYIGESTANEIAFALANDKPVEYLEEHND